jgi:hypoxanthine phosphoribosyltransferase
VGEQRVEQSLKYVGFSIPADFVVGFGLDVNERYRNLDAIYTYTGES